MNARLTVDSDPRAEQYVPATPTFEGERYAVQARCKGAGGGLRGCVGNGGFNAAGPKSCATLSKKVAFDQVAAQGRFYGLRKLQFHAMVREGKPLVIDEIDVEGPRRGEVLIEITATGVCHTDAFTLSADDRGRAVPRRCSATTARASSTAPST